MWPNQRGGRGGFGGPRFPMMGDFGGMRPHHGGGGNMMHGRGGGGFNMNGGGRMPMRGGGMPMHSGGGMQNQMRGGGGGMFPRGGGGDFRPRGARGARGRGGDAGGNFPENGPGSVVKKETQTASKVDTAPAATTPAPGTSSTAAGPASQVVPKGTGPGSKPIPAGPRHPAKPGEDEPNYDESLCILDWYCSDLNLKIKPTDFCSAEAMSKDGFGYMWAGARASYGATNGRVCFEVKIVKNQPTAHLEGEANPNVLRVGWSLPTSNLQLGEIKHSYGYGGTAKISENCNFQNYGVRFGVGSVVGAYLDMSTENCTIRYTVDGKDQGIAFRFQKKELKGKGLFPHVLTKNQDFAINFGQMPAPMRTLLTGYTPIGQLETKDGLIRGPLPPPSKADCQVLMMVGLPGAGKTFWAEKFAVENEDKHWNILGTNNLIEKMKVQGLNRKRNYSGRWETLIKKCMECFNILLGIAAKRRRNYILDQTNVYPTARGKKMKDFSGFECQAVVVVPTDDEYRRRVSEREAIEGKEVPDSAVLNMKCNFVLPEIEEASSFSEVWYTEMGPEDSQLIVTKYNQEAMSTGMRVQGGVMAFKTRNEGKRMRQKLSLPGMHVNPDKAPKLPSTPAPTPTPTPRPTATPIPTPTLSTAVKKETVTADVKPLAVASVVKAETTSAGPGPSKPNQQQIKDDRSQRRDSSRRSKSRSKGEKSSSRRRSRSRDRSHRDKQRSQSREKSKSDRRERRRSRDRSRDRDRTRKRSRSRSSRDKESGNQRFKQEINPWERGPSHNSADNNFAQNRGAHQGSRWNQEDGPGGRGGFSSTGRGRWEGGRDMDARGGRHESGFKQENDQSFRGGVGRGRGGYGDDRGRGGHFGGDRGGRGGFGDDRGGRGGFGGDRGGRGGFGDDRGGRGGMFGDDRGGRGGRFGEDRGGRGGRGGHPGDDRGGRGGRFSDDRNSREGHFGDNSRDTAAFNRNERDERRDFPQDQNPRENFPTNRDDRRGFNSDRGGRGGFRGGRGGFEDRSDKKPDMDRFDNESRRPPGIERNRGGLLDPPNQGSQDHQNKTTDRMKRGDVVSDAYAGQEGNNAYFNNVNNFGRPPSQLNDAPVPRDARDAGAIDNKPGFSGPSNTDRFSAGRAPATRFPEQNRLANTGPSTSQDRGTDYPRESQESQESQKSVKVRDLDEEFASRMERKLQDADYTTGGQQGEYQDEYYGEGDYGEGGGQGWGDEGGYDYNSGRDYNQDKSYDDYRNENRHDNSYAQIERDQKFGGRSYDQYQDKSHQSGYLNPNREQYDDHNQQQRQNSSQGSRFSNQNSSNFDGRMDGPPPRHGQGAMPPRQDPINSQVPMSNRPPPPLMTNTLPGPPSHQQSSQGRGDYDQHGRGDYNPQGRGDYNPQGRPDFIPHRTDSNPNRPQEMVGGPLLATTAMIPDWNKPTPQAQNNTALREEGYPITSDGRAMNMGYSVQYHSEDAYSQQDSYHEESVRVVHQKGPSTQGSGSATQSMDNKSFSATSRSSFSTNEHNNPSKERLNDPSALTGMNPTPPDASAAGSSSNGNQANPSQAPASGQANSGPDYASLLQYLQFYQKQMTTDTKK